VEENKFQDCLYKVRHINITSNSFFSKKFFNKGTLLIQYYNQVQALHLAMIYHHNYNKTHFPSNNKHQINTNTTNNKFNHSNNNNNKHLKIKKINNNSKVIRILRVIQIIVILKKGEE
jgi:hypothetical protein